MLSPPQSDSKKKKRCPGLLGEWTKWVGSFFRKKFHELATKLGTDLYILPSSIHECIALSVDAVELSDVVGLVETSNRTQVSLDERLSDRVYYYNKDSRSFSLAGEED